MEETTERLLSCELNEDEVAERSKRLAQAVEKYNSVEDAKKIATKRFTDEMKELRKEFGDLARQIETRKEKRNVLCFWRESFAENCKRLIRQDTEEVVETQAMTFEERQTQLDELS